MIRLLSIAGAIRRRLVLALVGVHALVVFMQPAHAQRSQPNPLKADEACLGCHGQADLKTKKGENISIDAEKHAASVHGILACTDCHTSIKEFPHPARIAKVRCATCHADASRQMAGSIHAVLGEAACESCHGNVHEVKRAAQAAAAKCAECHASEVGDLQQSVHGRAAAGGDGDAPNCASCHGAVHKILAANDSASLVAKKNLADTCAACHSKPDFLSRHRIPVAHPVELYKQSVHGRVVSAGKNAATCSDCHGTHGIFQARDTRSKINHWNIAETCGKCHAEISRTYLESVHGQAMKAGVRDAPVCSDCHGEHLILAPGESRSPVSVARVSMATCGRCHGDERLAQRYNLPMDRLPSYADSYHGLAMRGGSQTVANCVSCHGVHNIFPSSDYRSTVNPANLPKTCGNCHAGAGEKFAIGPVHVQIATGPAHPVVHWIRRIYRVLIPLTLGFMILHNLLDLLSKLVRQRVRMDSGERLVRMNLYFRIAHWGVMLTFPVLVITGFALRYPDAWWARPLLLWESHFAFRGVLHRIAAVTLMAATVYHAIHLAVNRRDRALLAAMLPRWKDVTDLAKALKFNIGLRGDEPKFAKFNYAEKLEYWAFLWGTVVMAISGFLLWFNNFTLRQFPKWVSDAATAVHWYEALLATFSILLWHLYFVIFDPLVYPMDLAWLTGKAPADHYRHARPAYFRAVQGTASTDSRPQLAAEPSDGEPPPKPSKTDAPGDTSQR